MRPLQLSGISEKTANSSAIPAWSGFIYQGKIVLYHAICLMINEDCHTNYLKVETLEDFVIHTHNLDVKPDGQYIHYQQEKNLN